MDGTGGHALVAGGKKIIMEKLIRLRSLVVTMLVVLTNLTVLGQEQGPKLTSVAQESGKYWVTTGVASIIFLGIVVYLVVQDRKIKQLEKRLEEEA